MRKNKAWMTVAAGLLCGLGWTAPGWAGESGIKVLSTTFPVHQLVRQVVEGKAGVTADLLLPSQLGCPHDYALTPQDMLKLAQADVLVINGLGLEEFLGAPVRKANPKMKVIDSSAGIRETLPYSDSAHHDCHAADHHDHGHPSHGGINPHLFASPRMTARLALTIAAGLSEADPEGATLYFKNARAVAEKMNRMADELTALGRRLKNNRIAQPHGVFDYLARDMGLEIVAVLQAHGQEPAAAEMIRLIQAIRETKAGAIFTEPQYPDKIGRLLSKETGIPVARLDPVASGPENAPLDYYERIMRQNMEILGSTLGLQ
ncbi:MAG: metal ABC transporter substrate-binding protein [Kiritimatiellia bacterium]|nr:metal ABC transporter substrate-binding protein [Kiritimatiellia bacterium]